MTIKKLGHCCLLIKHGELIILTDPGLFSAKQNKVTGIDIVLITHEHGDHLHVESVQAILGNNPQAKIYTNKGVGKILQNRGIAFELLEHSQKITAKGVEISGHGTDHAPIYPTVPNVINTGYFIGNKLFYPGDAFYNPGKPVEVLAVPVAGPWVLLSQAIDYAREVKPVKCFPVHDGMLREDRIAVAHRIPEMVLADAGIKFIPLLEGQEIEV